MAKTVSHLKIAVAGFMQRDPKVFIRSGIYLPSTQYAPGAVMGEGGGVVLGEGYDTAGNFTGSFDLLLQACNNARLYAERKLDLEYAKVQIDIPNVSLTNGASTDASVLTGTSTAVRIKKIRVPYLPLQNGGAYPVDLWTRRRWDDRVKRRYEKASPFDTLDWTKTVKNITSPFVVVQDGKLLFVAPLNQTDILTNPFTLSASAIQWLNEYVTGAENDFLLDFAFDWMMYRAIWELNFFLKEDERVNLSDKLINDAWDSVVKWNNELVNANVDDFDLD